MTGEEPNKKPGPVRQFIRSTFGFRKTTLTFLVVLTYLLATLLSFYFEHKATETPSPEPDILTNSWFDLQSISKEFHPYTSPANDRVHDYILERVQKLAENKSYIEVSDDYGSLKTIINQQEVFDPTSIANRIIYFESSNVLVKIEGKNPSLEGILVSAHFDSVPTAYGTTDDGMGIASMLGILEHFSTKGVEQPDRTIVLNFNNDEEFGLLGAEMFFEHEWSSLVKVFINLEGTGAGGRAILFRSTDNGVLSYYKDVERPFANSLFQQGFQSGLIRSETDYKIYTRNGLRGVDIAFFKPRALYHTKRDSITGTSKGSLWHMEKSALDMTVSFAYDTAPLNNDNSKGVYFDIFGYFFINISVDTLYVINLLIVIIVPVITLFFLLIVYKRGTWFVDVGRGWLRFPISVLLAWSITSFVAKYIYVHDPLILSNDYISPLLALSSLNILLNYGILNFTSWLRPVHDQKLIGILELNGLTWLLTIWMIVQQKTTYNVAANN
ncbi:unnamed protein product [Ambrosiozyma monospora]|uniref:Unnamed protein product n=1 Tax=Ambrosiozyma monospora TaxID=43982 RepID=A0ACB5T566_AMBMO|nr:unnamed protein product [Ambrosiozyma monospora]